MNFIETTELTCPPQRCPSGSGNSPHSILHKQINKQTTKSYGKLTGGIECVPIYGHVLKSPTQAHTYTPYGTEDRQCCFGLALLGH